MKLVLYLMMTLILTVWMHDASADGGFFFAEAGVGYSAEQQAILIFDEAQQRETMILSTGQDWDNPTERADYAWVVPVPSLMRQEDFTVFEEGQFAFEELYYLTEPRASFFHQHRRHFGCGCPGAEKALGPEDPFAPAGVTELVSFEMDQYDIHILSADDSPKLQSWLQERGYAFPPEAIPTLQYYIDKDWYFTAVKISLPQQPGQGNGGEGETVVNQPSKRLQMTFDTRRCVYPLRISSVSSRPEKRTGILLYVFTAHRVWARNFITLQMTKPARTYSTVEEFQTVYRQEFANLLESADGRAFVAEYADYHSSSYWLTALQPLLAQHNAYFLTRLRTELLPEDMDADVEFIPAPSDSRFRISGMIKPVESAYGGPDIRFAYVLGLMVLFFALSFRLRRPMRVRAYLVGVLLSMLVL